MNEDKIKLIEAILTLGEQVSKMRDEVNGIMRLAETAINEHDQLRGELAALRQRAGAGSSGCSSAAITVIETGGSFMIKRAEQQIINDAPAILELILSEYGETNAIAEVRRLVDVAKSATQRAEVAEEANARCREDNILLCNSRNAAAEEWRWRAETAEAKLAAVPVQAMLECIRPDDYDFSASLAAVEAFAIWLEAQREQQSKVQQ